MANRRPRWRQIRGVASTTRGYGRTSWASPARRPSASRADKASTPRRSKNSASATGQRSATRPGSTLERVTLSADLAGDVAAVLDEAELKNVPVREYVRFSEDGHFLWPGYRDNLRPLIWLLQLNNGEVTGTQTPVGILPTIEELDLEGCDIAPD